MKVAMEAKALTQPEGSFSKIGQWPARVKNYFDELQAEMRRVTWPSWKQVRATTAVVIIAVFAFAAYFYIVDIVISKSLQRVLDLAK